MLERYCSEECEEMSTALCNVLPIYDCISCASKWTQLCADGVAQKQNIVKCFCRQEGHDFSKI